MARANGGVVGRRRRPLIIFTLAAGAVALVALAVAPAPAATGPLPRQTGNPCEGVVDEVRFAGSTSAQIALNRWGAAICQEHDVVANGLNNGSKGGRDAVIAGSTDIGLTTLPFTDEEQAALVEAKRGVVMIPILGTATVCTYWDAKASEGYPDGEAFPDMRMSRQTVGLMLGGSVLTTLGDGDPPSYGDSLKIDNAETEEYPTELQYSLNTEFHVRPGYSGVTYELGRWIDQDPEAVEAFEWASAQNYEVPEEAVLPFELMPNPRGDVPTLTSEYDAMFTKMRGAIAAMSIACMDAATARIDSAPGLEGVQQVNRAFLENAAGEFVEPTDAAVELGIEAMVANGDGTFRPNPSKELTRAYVMPMVVYAAVPTCGFAETTLASVTKVLDYAVGDGQENLPEGNIALTGPVAASATRQLASWKDKAVARPCIPEEVPPTTTSTTLPDTTPTTPTETPYVPPPTDGGVQPDPGYVPPAGGGGGGGGGTGGGGGGGGGVPTGDTTIPSGEEVATGPVGDPVAPVTEDGPLEPVARIVAMAQGSAAIPPLALVIGALVFIVLGPVLQTADGLSRAGSFPGVVKRWFTRLRP